MAAEDMVTEQDTVDLGGPAGWNSIQMQAAKSWLFEVVEADEDCSAAPTAVLRQKRSTLLLPC